MDATFDALVKPEAVKKEMFANASKDLNRIRSGNKKDTQPCNYGHMFTLSSQGGKSNDLFKQYTFMKKNFTKIYMIKEIIREEQGKQGLDEMEKK